MPLMSQLHTIAGFMSLRVLGAPNRAAAASVAAELGMSAIDPKEFARQHALSSGTTNRSVPAVAEALLVLGHVESSLEFTGELVRTRACPRCGYYNSSCVCASTQCRDVLVLVAHPPRREGAAPVSIRNIHHGCGAIKHPYRPLLQAHIFAQAARLPRSSLIAQLCALVFLKRTAVVL